MFNVLLVDSKVFKLPVGMKPYEAAEKPFLTALAAEFPDLDNDESDNDDDETFEGIDVDTLTRQQCEKARKKACELFYLR